MFKDKITKKRAIRVVDGFSRSFQKRFQSGRAAKSTSQTEHKEPAQEMSFQLWFAFPQSLVLYSMQSSVVPEQEFGSPEFQSVYGMEINSPVEDFQANVDLQSVGFGLWAPV